MKHAPRAVALLAVASGAALAQKTGALLHVADSARAVLRPLATTPQAAARSDTIFAALVFDPSLAALARASAWTASVVPGGGSKEARLQLNLCDVAGATCGLRGAASLMLAGPLNKDDDFTELADLNGLVNSARVEANWSNNTTSVGSYVALSGTFSQPTFAYRDTAALARRSAGHTAYAISAGGGYRWASAALLGAVRWEQSYHARATENVCTPASFGPDGTQSCANMVLGPPSRSERAIASISAAWSIGGSAAARLTVSQDVRHGVTGIDLPVWILTNPAGGLAGGVRFGYRTDARQMTIGLFVSEFKL